MGMPMGGAHLVRELQWDWLHGGSCKDSVQQGLTYFRGAVLSYFLLSWVSGCILLLAGETVGSAEWKMWSWPLCIFNSMSSRAAFFSQSRLETKKRKFLRWNSFMQKFCDTFVHCVFPSTGNQAKEDRGHLRTWDCTVYLCHWASCSGQGCISKCRHHADQ